MSRWLLTLSAFAHAAFWIVAIATDWDAKTALIALWLGGLPSIVAPFYAQWTKRRQPGRADER